MSVFRDKLIARRYTERGMVPPPPAPPKPVPVVTAPKQARTARMPSLPKQASTGPRTRRKTGERAQCPECHIIFDKACVNQIVCSAACRKSRNQHSAQAQSNLPPEERLCRVCGTVFFWIRRHQVLCGREDCSRVNDTNRRRDRRQVDPAPHARVCARCETPFTAWYSKARFCSRRCRWEPVTSNQAKETA